ncbi:MAG: pseudouridine synthase [Paracoccaceae bacterium]|nr:pseudouridine synthase [Paracoccaceae bacterium]
MTPTGSSDPSAVAPRIARVLARAGLASRRGAERLISEGRVTVNGVVLTSPAVRVAPFDAIAVDGIPLPAPEPSRLFRYHKPRGLLTTTRDDRGRPTVFESLPGWLPRVVSVGRLDLNSEGLLLFTNDGGLKRRFELPKSGMIRTYRVRALGRPVDSGLDQLRRGLSLDDESFRPMSISLDSRRNAGANCWLTVELNEGRNREIRRAFAAIGLTVNRLIRTAYGPFRLGDLAPGAVEEVSPAELESTFARPAATIGQRTRGKSRRKDRSGGRPRNPARRKPSASAER